MAGSNEKDALSGLLDLNRPPSPADGLKASPPSKSQEVEKLIETLKKLPPNPNFIIRNPQQKFDI